MTKRRVRDLEDSISEALDRLKENDLIGAYKALAEFDDDDESASDENDETD